MGEALLAGLLAADWAPAGELRVVEALAPRRAELTERFPGVEVTDTVGPAEGTVLATKPGDIPAACAALGPDAGTGAVHRRRGPPGRPRGRPPDGHAGGAGHAQHPGPGRARAPRPSPGARRPGDDDLDWAEQILSAVGTVVRVAEPLLDAVTGLSGSGPAYVFLVAEALVEAGVLVGLPRPVAAELAVQTLLGSARLLAEGDDGPEALRAAVTSPGGTTAAGLRALEQAGVRAAFLDAVVAATERSRELGG